MIDKEKIDEAAKNYCEGSSFSDACMERPAFIAGAKWGYERMVEKACRWLEENAKLFVALADDEHPAIGDTEATYGTKSLIHYFIMAMKE